MARKRKGSDQEEQLSLFELDVDLLSEEYEDSGDDSLAEGILIQGLNQYAW